MDTDAAVRDYRGGHLKIKESWRVERGMNRMNRNIQRPIL